MAIDYTSGPGVMLQLGSFQFGVTTAAYQELKRTTEWRWPSQDQFGKLAAVQFVGPGNDSITLPGVIYPEWRGGLTQLDALRALGDTGEPQTMIDGRGKILGKWVIERVDEGQQVFAAAGVPRRQEFTLQLRRIHDDGAATVPIPAAVPAAATTPAIPSTATTPASKVTGLADSVASAAKNIQGEIASAYANVQAAVGPIVSVASSTTGAVLRAASVASDLLFAANRVRAVVGKSPINNTALAEAKALADKANILMTGASSAGAILRRTTAKLEGMAGATKASVTACRNAANTAESLAALCRKTATEAAKIE